METVYHTNRNACRYLSLLMLSVVLVASSGCARMYHAVHYNGIARTLHEQPRNYFHSEKTGRIIPKEKCYCPVELPCYGYEPTCWRRWPEGCVRCPVADEVVDGEMLIHEGDTLESSAEAVFPPQPMSDKPDVVSPDISVDDTPNSTGSAQAKKPAPDPVQFDVQPKNEYYHFASDPTQQLSPYVPADETTSVSPDDSEYAATPPQPMEFALTTSGEADPIESHSDIDASVPSRLQTQAESLPVLNDYAPDDRSDSESGVIDQTIDALIGREGFDEASKSEAANSNEDDLTADEKVAQVDNVTDIDLEESDGVADAGPFAVDMETTEFEDAMVDDGEVDAERGEVASSDTSTEDSTVDKPSSPQDDVSTFRPSVLPNFALPKPIQRADTRMSDKSSSRRKANPANSNSDRKPVTQKSLPTNMVRFRVETRGAETVVPTEESENSRSTIQFK